METLINVLLAVLSTALCMLMIKAMFTPDNGKDSKMNDKIKELAEQAGIHFHKGGTLDAGTNGVARFVLYSDMEKFAELLIREAASLTLPYLNESYYNGWLDYRDEIKQHFGIEDAPKT